MHQIITTVKTKIANQLPGILGKPIQLLPFILQKHLVTNVLQHVFKEALAAGDMAFLTGLHLKFEVTDCKLSWTYTFNGQSLQMINTNRADASIRCNMREFVLLVNQRVDPDTLFFQRRLVIEGNTELGLTMKNLMDTLDPESLPVSLVKGLHVMEYLLTPE